MMDRAIRLGGCAQTLCEAEGSAEPRNRPGHVPVDQARNHGAGRGRAVVDHLQRLIALPGLVAFVVVDYLAVRTQAVVSMLAPEEPVVAVLPRGIPSGFDKLPLPVEVLATVHADVG